MASVGVGELADRTAAGRLLGEALAAYRGRAGLVVLGLARGGVVVAAEVARWLQAPLDVFVVCRLGVPGHEELGIGAVASGRVRVLNDDVLERLRVPDQVLDRVSDRERRELERRERAYRG